ncbi:unnamed protein product [Adineta ricciae]|uniref:Uncharacterized protein n=1 Tax=Adineta ricciae TaxID=249248 RepID=A0A814BMR2_ADIRI|nr:unnamed protein product [Adineta ricciae]CAF0928975.1 unnamed protein product [Adineta ricciae]
MLIFPRFMSGMNKEIIVDSPFHLRARIFDSRTAHVQFEISGKDEQRRCEKYQFTVRRNQETPYSMPEQNLTYWRNSLELQHLPVGQYQVCAIICSEHSQHAKYHYKSYMKKNRTLPITACVSFRVLRAHLLILTLYVFVIMFLAISQMIFSLRKRQFHQRIKLALTEVENSLTKWRTTQAPPPSIDQTQSYTILQSLVTLPATPIDYTIPYPPVETNEPVERPIIFHLEPPNDS